MNTLIPTTLLLLLAVIAAAGAEPPAEGNRPATVALILDKSGSMATGNRASSMKTAAKLAVAVLDKHQQLVVIDFEQKARSARFSLGTPAERQAAMAHTDSIAVGGGTNYLAALQASNLPAGTPAVFLSDGEHNGDPALVLEYLKTHQSGPLFTIAVEASPAADKLLSEMAALTGGSHVKVDDSEGLVKALLDIAKRLGNYRAYAPREEEVRCRAAAGRLIAFGFDAIPSVDAEPPLPQGPYRHSAALPGEQVNVAAIDLANPSDVTIKATQKKTANGRLGTVLRQDLVRAKMEVFAPGGKAATGTAIRVTTSFSDRQGKPIDPRKRPDLSSVFQLFDQAGKLLHKAVGKPSPTEPVLEATLPLPKQPGAVTIRNDTGDASQGPNFQAEQSRTIILQRPVPLSAEPATITRTIKEGRFTTTFTLKAAGEDLTSANFRASLEGTAPGLRLVQAQSKGSELTLDLEATQPGTYRAALVIQGAGITPFVPLRVPVELTVTQRLLGLALPPVQALALGPILANSGRQTIATLTIPSLDTEATDYIVDITDLSNGKDILATRAEPIKISPTKEKRARVTIAAELGNLPAGEFTGAAVIRLRGSGAVREWRINLALAITEPLTVQPLDFGKVEVNKVVQGTLRIKNTGEALREVRLGKLVLKGKGGDIIGTLPEKIDLGARQDREVPVSLAVSPLIESRGKHHTNLIVSRAPGLELNVPVEIHIVGVGEGPCSLRVAPARVQFVARRDQQVQQFQVRVKYAPDVSLAAAEELQAEASGFMDAAGKACPLEIAFKWVPGSRLTHTTPVVLQGFFVTPARPGRYSGRLTIRSAASGNVTIPITLDVQ